MVNPFHNGFQIGLWDDAHEGTQIMTRIRTRWMERGRGDFLMDGVLSYDLKTNGWCLIKDVRNLG